MKQTGSTEPAQRLPDAGTCVLPLRAAPSPCPQCVPHPPRGLRAPCFYPSAFCLGEEWVSWQLNLGVAGQGSKALVVLGGDNGSRLPDPCAAGVAGAQLGSCRSSVLRFGYSKRRCCHGGVHGTRLRSWLLFSSCMASVNSASERRHARRAPNPTAARSRACRNLHLWDPGFPAAPALRVRRGNLGMPTLECTAGTSLPFPAESGTRARFCMASSCPREGLRGLAFTFYPGEGGEHVLPQP